MDIKWQTTLMLLQTSLFVSAWHRLHHHVQAHGPVPGAARVIKINSRIYSVFSLVFLVLIFSPKHEVLAQRLYHASKFYEYVDILNICANGGDVGLHFGFHHLTTCYLTFVRVVHNSEGWRPFAALNAFHHTLMYAYFGGLQFPRPVLPCTGALQLVVGIVLEVWVARRKATAGQEPVWPNALSGCLLVTYLVLSTRELLRRGVEGKAAKEKPEEGIEKNE